MRCASPPTATGRPARGQVRQADVEEEPESGPDLLLELVGDLPVRRLQREPSRNLLASPMVSRQTSSSPLPFPSPPGWSR